MIFVKKEIFICIYTYTLLLLNICILINEKLLNPALMNEGKRHPNYNRQPQHENIVPPNMGDMAINVLKLME
jgi:hypothetical protein